MKKIILLALLIIIALTICIVDFKMEYMDAFEPGISESSNYNGVLV